MSDPRGRAGESSHASQASHASHDLELVARAAAGDLTAAEALTARDRLAACPVCAALAADLRVLATATRDLRGTSPGPAPRDFRLTDADAHRLRRRGLLVRSRGGWWSGGRSRGFGGALATLGLVGLLVSAGLPALLGGGSDLTLSAGGGVRLDEASPAAAPAGQSQIPYELNATDDPALITDGARREEVASPPAPSPIPALAALTSALLLVTGILLLVLGRARRGSGT